MPNEMVPAPDQGLALQGGNIRLASEACSRGLWTLLTETDSGQNSVRLIAINPKIKAELERVRPFLEERARPMTPEQIVARIAMAAPVYAIPDMDPSAWSMAFKAYAEALAGWTAEALDHAFVLWDQGKAYPKDPGLHRFMPKPADLFRLGQQHNLELRTAVWRAKKAAEYIDNHPKPPTPEERAADRQAAIDAGILTVDETGKVKFNLQLGQVPKERATLRPGETPKQFAERIRAEADRLSGDKGSE